jgi:hypothetical protein
MPPNFVVPRWLDVTTKIVRMLGFGAFFVFLGLFFHYSYTLSTVPNQRAGEIYPLNNHGHIVYLNHQQNLRLDLWGWLAALFAVIFVLIWAYIRSREDPMLPKKKRQ